MKTLTKYIVLFLFFSFHFLPAQHRQQLNWETSLETINYEDYSLGITSIYLKQLTVDNKDNSYVSGEVVVDVYSLTMFERFNIHGFPYAFSNWGIPWGIRYHRVAGFYSNSDLVLLGSFDPWFYSEEISLARIDTSGRVLWHHTSATTFPEYDDFFKSTIHGVFLDTNENLYIAGEFGSWTQNKHDFTLAGQTIPGGWGIDLFMAKFSPEGELLWLKHIEREIPDFHHGGYTDSPIEQIEGFAINETGNIAFDYVFKEFGYYVSDTSQTPTVIPETHYSTLFDENGVLLSKIELDFPARNYRERFELKNFTESVTVGDQALTSNGGTDFYFAKYSSSGDLLWLIHEGGSGEEFARDYTFDTKGNLYIIGDFSDEFTVDNTTLTCPDSADIFVLKYDSYLANVWAISHNSPGDDWTERAAQIAVSDSGLLYLTGQRIFENVTGRDSVKVEAFLAQFTVHPSATTQCDYHNAFDSAGIEGWYASNPNYWHVVNEGGNGIYSINTSDYYGASRDGLGAFSVLAGKIYADFDFAFRARSEENLSENPNGDYALVFAYEDAENYYYAMINGSSYESAVYQMISEQPRRLVLDMDVAVSDNQFHLFRARRTGDLVEFFLDDQLFGTLDEPDLSVGALGFGSYNDMASFDDVCIKGRYEGQIMVTATLPRIEATFWDTVEIPVTLSTTAEISFAQMIVEYDSTILKLLSIEPGKDAAGFLLQTNLDLGFEPTGFEVNENILFQLSGTGIISGEEQQVAKLNFQVINLANGATPLLFDLVSGGNSFTTNSAEDIKKECIEFQNGVVKIVKEYTTQSVDATYLGFDSTQIGAPIGSATVIVKDFLDKGSGETDATGAVAISHVIKGPGEIAITKSGDNQRAITGSDALLVLRHLALLDTLNTNQLLAADINQSGTVTGADTILLLKYIAYFTEGTGATGDWFFDSPQSLLLGSRNVSFTGYSLGDANLNWIASESLASTQKTVKLHSQRQTTLISLPTLHVFPEDTLDVPILISSEDALSFLQITIEFDSSVVEFIDVWPGENTWNMGLLLNPSPPFLPQNAQATKNIVLQLSSASERVFGENQELALIRFAVIGTAEQVSPLVIDILPGHTALVTTDYTEISSDFITVTPGQIFVQKPSEVKEAERNLPTKFSMQQNYPNPFCKSLGFPQLSDANTVIEYTIPVGEDVQVTLKIYNIKGQLVGTLVNTKHGTGVYKVMWNGQNELGQTLPSGVYLYEIEAGHFRQVKRLILLR
ncbi:MAG: T9SS type A sorting domain-containing protein [Deferribacteres bacterium]|nr:T9SS type A sorting domain-containing protein [Deferribacteres bacterium]